MANKAGMEAIVKLSSTEPIHFLKQNPELSLTSRIASQYLFSLLKPYTPKTPFDELHTEGFDAEQIWQQIDIQSQPLISSLGRDVNRYEKNPEKISSLFGEKEEQREFEDGFDVGLVRDSEEEEEESESEGESESEDGDEDGEEEDEDMEEDDGDGTPEVEDDFFKIKELEKFLAAAEEEEYGGEESVKKKLKKKKGNDGKVSKKVEEEEEGDDDESESDEDTNNADTNELLMFGGMDDSEDEDAYNIRFEDFYLPNKKLPNQREKRVDKSYDLEMENEDEDETNITLKRRKQVNESQEVEMDDGEETQKNENLSTHERERQKLQAKIKQMEEANLAAKDWTMRGEVQASNRPRDSALEVDLDFEHNVRPPPVITEEVTTSLEDIIKKRISEERFDDVQRPPKLPSAAPRERKELDDNKSKKGLAEIYEEEYAQQTGLAAAPLSHNDELRKEASGLFKKLCLKLDALSHFHFAPKPVVEDMCIQTNVAALAMEEIAPIAVSDAALLAPEEVFAGKGDMKEDAELTKEDRKKKRAKIKRKFKAVNAGRTANKANKPAEITLQYHTEGKEH